MECKYVTKGGRNAADAELIDTLWNVNSFDTVSATGTTLELIDTLWNVNETAV